MPIYRYHCAKCDTEFNALELAGDPATSHCQACNSAKLTRLPSVPGVQFKGKGFYVTDRSKRSGGGNGNGAGKAPGGDGKGDAAGKAAGPSKGNDGPSAKADPKPVSS